MWRSTRSTRIRIVPYQYIPSAGFYTSYNCLAKGSTNQLNPKNISQNTCSSQKLSDDFSSHDHIHLRESEIEKNDSLRLGSMLTRIPQHSHTHSHDFGNPLLVLSREQFKTNPGVKITWIGLMINVGLALGKFVGGVVFHSQALIADSIHALSDLISDFLTLFSVGLASRKSSKDYPYGFGKIETVGSLTVSSVLAIAGLSIGWSSLCSIVGPIIPHTLLEMFSTHGHSHIHSHDITDINAAWIAAGSIAVKEWIFRATKKVAEDTRSNVLMANAWHHRVDSLTSLVALVTISFGYLFNIHSLDAFGGLLVSGLIVKAGAQGIMSSINELIDKSLPNTDARYLEIETLTKNVLEKMLSNNNSNKPYKINDLMVLTSGPNTHAHMILEVPLQRWNNLLTINEFEIVTDHLRSVLYKDIPSLKRVNVEFTEERPELTEEEKSEIIKQKQLESSLMSKSDFNNEYSNKQTVHTHSHFGFGSDHTHKH